MLLPRLSDSLTGRMESVRLTTLSECEIEGYQPKFLSKLRSMEAPSTQETRLRDHLLHRVIVGCFPEPLQRTSERRSTDWHRQYINSLIQRDIQDLTHIDHPDMMTKLLKLTTFYAGKWLNRLYDPATCQHGTRVAERCTLADRSNVEKRLCGLNPAPDPGWYRHPIGRSIRLCGTCH